MQERAPFFLLKTRDTLILILFIVGIALLMVSGSKAISDASDRKYIDGWQNRPFRAPSVVTRTEPLTLEQSANIQTLEPVKVPSKTESQTVPKEKSSAGDGRRVSTLRESSANREDNYEEFSFSLRRVLNSLGF